MTVQTSLISVAILLLLYSQADAQGDADWMQQVCRVPKEFEALSGNGLTPIAMEGQHVDQRKSAWVVERDRLRKAWREYLGSMPELGRPVQATVLESQIDDGVSRELIRYEGEPGIWVEGYLVRPEPIEAGQRYPGIVAFHPTVDDNIAEIAGVKTKSSRATAYRIAKLGYVVFCPRCFLWQDCKDFSDAVRKHRERHPETTGMAKMLYDAQRAVDVLESLSFVDRESIGAFGHSLGAKETLYLAAFDDRISVSVASEGGIALDSTNWDATWYLGESIKAPTFTLNHHQLLAMIAPRPFLVLGGESGQGAADGNRTWPYLAAARPAWKLYECEPKLGLLNHHQGHVYGDEQYAKTVQWLDRTLK